MKKYHVRIEEVIAQSFEIEAENAKQAGEIAIDRYKNGEIVLDNAECINRDAAVFDNAELNELEYFHSF